LRRYSAIDRKKHKGDARLMGGRSWALDPFVVTKHQPSNGQRARGPAQKQMTPGANGLFRGASGVFRGGLADHLPGKGKNQRKYREAWCERQMHKSAQFPAQPAIIAGFQG
jgi:hypothetical protein